MNFCVIAPLTSSKINAGRRRNPFLVSLVAIVTVLMVGVICLGGWFGLALTQHETAGIPRVVAGAARLEYSGSDLILITSPGIWLERAYKNGVFQMNGDALDRLLAQRGWKHTDQEGSGRVFTRGHQTLRVSCHMFSRRYQVCQAQDAW